MNLLSKLMGIDSSINYNPTVLIRTDGTESLEFVRRSIVSGVVRTLIIDATLEQWNSYKNGKLIQEAFPNLTATEREFIMTGITEDEWDHLFSDKEL